MSLQLSFPWLFGVSFPRTCGDEPKNGAEDIIKALVFPAPAGMSRVEGLPVELYKGFPRTCGDEPSCTLPTSLRNRFSPHLRG